MEPLTRGVLLEPLEETFSDTQLDSTAAVGTLRVLEASENVFQAPIRVINEKAAMTHPTIRRNDVRAFPFHPAASQRSKRPGVVPRTNAPIATAARIGSPVRITASSMASVNPHGRRNVSAPRRAGAVFCASAWENRRLRLSGSGREMALRFGNSPVMEMASRSSTIPVMAESIATKISESFAAVQRNPKKNPPTAYAPKRPIWKKSCARRLRRETP